MPPATRQQTRRPAAARATPADRDRDRFVDFMEGRPAGRPRRDGPAPRPRAGFDAAKTTDENRKHWGQADSLAPVSQLTPQVRAVLRNRARHECLNNCYASGLVRTLVNDTVGRGPRLQLLTDDPALNRAVEDLWRVWAAACDLPLSLRVLAGCRYVAGEGFALFRESKRLERLGLPVALDVRLVEPDQVAHPYGQTWLTGPTGDDGVVCDADGEVVAYKVLRAHPGDGRYGAEVGRGDEVPAADVLHWFAPERPGQLRGYTPLAPALNVFAQLRRFTTATLTAAEVAALLAGVLELPDAPPGDADPAPSYETMDTIELVRGMLLTVPGGGKVTQFKPEQPTTGYDAFVAAKLKEVGRCLNVPYGKIAGDHSAYNYSSGRMDDGPYWADREVERQALEAKVFDPLFHRWCDFARFALPGLAAFKGRWWELRHVWHYDARPVLDPVKDATADERNLTNGSDTLAGIAARDGLTVEALVEQRARERDLFEARGLPLPPWLAGAPAPPRPGDGEPQNPADGRGATLTEAPA